MLSKLFYVVRYSFCLSSSLHINTRICGHVINWYTCNVSTNLLFTPLLECIIFDFNVLYTVKLL